MFKKAIQLVPEQKLCYTLSQSGNCGPMAPQTTRTEKLIDIFLELKLKDRQRDYADVGKSNVFEAFEDLRKESQALDKRERNNKY